jgi:hypothetical protein
MNLFALGFFLVSALSLLAVPRKWAPVPLLVGCCYMTMGQGVDVGPFSLPIYRMMFAIGLLRVLVRGERFTGRLNTIDKLLIGWALWVFTASLFHEWAPGSGPVFASGLIFNIVLVYFLVRTFCRDLNEVVDITRITALLLVPVALEMVFEHLTGTNMFSVFGGVPEEAFIRDGAIRAQGPFRHPILAGTVGAVCFPLMISLWRHHTRAAIAGASACLVMVVASASSGPIVSLLFGAVAVGIWRYHRWIPALWTSAIGVYLFLELVMSRPAYYIISKVDLTGSSTGWHRSRLIEAAVEYFGEWWLVGTDHTRHWTGVSVEWSEQHADITNYYLLIGVIAGFPAMLLLIAMMWRAFRWVGEIVRKAPPERSKHSFMVWCLGSGLFAHATTSLSIAYFDQSVVFFWLNIAVISATRSILTAEPGLPPLPLRSGLRPARPIPTP